MHPQRTPFDHDYLPISDRWAGFVVGGFLVVCALIVTGIGVAVMMWLT